MFKHLLVPTDGSALSDAALQMAVALAKEHSANLTVLHVIPEFHMFTSDAEMLGDTKERFQQVAQQHAEAFLAAATAIAQHAGVECEAISLTEAHAHEAIIDVATRRNCDLIVMASHGRSGARALLIGSETQKVLTHSDIPVLVVRPPKSLQPRNETTPGATGAPRQSRNPPFISL
ncbi:universal stress protein [Burkholderia ubonensis]|uniref:Universal stress protein n=1 Tax=Burkholderia ubonensis TaxID=101571 RepID=A0AAW3MXY3_9BURK|nr:universal stress protein [Burkholderia ubonensis]KVT41310.1 universal stress protein [Burkholderia ubonensis]